MVFVCVCSKPGLQGLSRLSRQQRDQLRAHQAKLTHFAQDTTAQLVSVTKPDDMKTFLQRLLEFTDASGKIHRKPRQRRSSSGQDDDGDDLMTSSGSVRIPVGDRLSGLSKKAAAPIDPLQGYFDKTIWQKAKAFAYQDACADADVLLASKHAVAREKSVQRWASLTAARDRAMERAQGKPAKAAALFGYGPGGDVWEQVNRPPILSVIRARAVPSSNKGLALATAVAVQKHTGIEASLQMSGVNPSTFTLGATVPVVK